MGNVEDPDLNFAQLLQYELDSEYVRYEQQTKITKTDNTIATADDYLNTSKGIIDPNWEFIDPTPNITNLFIAFNEKYFWGKLVTVCVVWSKRMMSCAGICSYEGRGGLCKIALSEPLLKLRPRKDLVETLLHEMIHAYLFVTNNNRDRDGHGPEFHKHMNRINTSAGTKISVYHSFHDEVRLYQQHWWRCNGPCQKKHPFYGMVRRSQNRAPGPNDRWYADHQRNCAGKFIKIKEPEKAPTAKEKAVSKQKPKLGDIRKYLNTSGSPVRSDASASKTSTNNGVNVIHGFHDLTLAQPSKDLSNNNRINTNANSNVVGINNFKQPGFTGLKSNSSTTVIVTKKNINKTPNKVKTPPIVTNPNTNIKNYDVVRNFWINKFKNTSPPKHYLNEDKAEVVAKKPRVNETNNIICPICSKEFSETKINDHIDVCLGPPPSSEKCKCCGDLFSSCELNEHFKTCPKNKIVPKFTDCPICLKKIEIFNLEEHVNKCIDNNTVDDSVQLIEMVKCDTCIKHVPVQEYESHVKNCVIDIINLDSFDEDFKYVKCTCGKTMDSDQYKKHKIICDEAEKDLITNHCFTCNTDIDIAIYADHLVHCTDKMEYVFVKDSEDECAKYESPKRKRLLEDLESFDQDFNYVQCNCGKTMESDEYKTHKIACKEAEKDDTNHCHICQTDIDAAIYADHLVQCFDKVMEDVPGDNVETVNNIEIVPCLVCNKPINKTELEQHLDLCLNDTVVDINDFDDEFNEEGKSDSSLNNTANMYHCPVCLKLLKDEEMNSHLDECLKDK